MQRMCDQCGVAYQAKRAVSRFCSDRCRVRNQRSSKPAAEAPPPALIGGSLTRALRVELEAVGRVDTVPGQQALTLAGKMESPVETGTGVASLSREFRAVREAALQGTSVAHDPMDELKARRDGRRAAAS